MSTAQQNLEVARLNLHAAQAAAEQEKRAKARQDLTAARAAGRRLVNEIKAKTTAFHQAQAECVKLQAELENTSSTLRNLVPPGGEFPWEEDLAQHEAVRAHLTAEHDVLLSKYRAATERREPLRANAVLLNSQLEQTRYSIRNLAAMVRGEKIGGGWEGGLRRL